MSHDCATLSPVDSSEEHGFIPETLESVIEKLVNTFLHHELDLVGQTKVREMCNIFKIQHNAKINKKYNIIAMHKGTAEDTGKTYVMWQVDYGIKQRGYIVLYESKKRAEDARGPHGLQNAINVLYAQLSGLFTDVDNLRAEMGQVNYDLKGYQSIIGHIGGLPAHLYQCYMELTTRINLMAQRMQELNNMIDHIKNLIHQKIHGHICDTIYGTDYHSGAFITTDFSEARQKMLDITGLRRLIMLNKKQPSQAVTTATEDHDIQDNEVKATIDSRVLKTMTHTIN